MKLNLKEGQEPLWDKDSVKNVIKQIQKGIKVPYADGLGLGALSRRDEHPAIMGKISVDDKKDWRNGYIENSRWALVRIEADGTIDTVRMNGYSDYKTRKKVPVLRKSKNKDLRQIIDRLGKYFTVVRLKHPDVKNEGKINEATVRLSTMKDANFEPGQYVQILGKKGTVKLDKKSVKFLAKWIRSNSGKHGMGWSFTEAQIKEGKTLTLPNGVRAKIDFKGIILQQKGKKPVFLDRGELLKFFRATTKYLRYS